MFAFLTGLAAALVMVVATYVVLDSTAITVVERTDNLSVEVLRDAEE